MLYKQLEHVGRACSAGIFFFFFCPWPGFCYFSPHFSFSAILHEGLETDQLKEDRLIQLEMVASLETDQLTY